MRLFIAHTDSPRLTGINASTWSSLSGVPSLPWHGRAVDVVLSKAALIAGNTSSTPRLHVFDIYDYTVLQTHDMPSDVNDFGVAPDDSFVAVAHVSGNRLSYLNTADWTLTSPVGLIPNTANSVDVHKNSDWVGVAHNNSPYFTVVSKADDSYVFQASIFSTTCNGVSFSPDGSLVAVSIEVSSGNNVVIFDTSTWEVEQTLSLGNTARSVKFSPDGAYLVCGRSFNPSYRIYRTSDWGEETVTDVASTVWGARFDPTGTLLALAHSNPPYYSVRNVGTWDNAIDADFPATLPNTGFAAVWVPDHFGSQAVTAPMSTFDAAGTFDAADNVAAYAATAPMITYDSAAVVTELFEADYAVDAIVPVFDSHAQLEIRATYAVAAPMAEIDYTAITGLEIEQPLPFETTLGPIGLGFGFTGDAFALDSSAVFSVATHFISRMASSSEMDTALKGGMTFSEVASMADAATISHVLAMLDTLGLSGSEDIKHIKAMIFLSEMVSESELPLPNINAAVNLASALTLRSFDAYGVQIDEISTMELAAAFDLRYTAVLAAMSDMELASTAALNTRVHAVFLSTMEQDGTFDSQALLQMEFESLLGGYSVLQIGDDVYEGWVVNIGEERRGGKDVAMSTYENYPFTAITMFKGKPYGIAADGLYLLEGDSDDGAVVQAALKTGLLDLGQRQLKDAKALYLGYTSDGQLVLKVTTTSGGKKREDWYRLRHGEADDMRTSRVTIQRGLRSTYWQFELCNVDGADFELDDVTLVYQLMTRRIRR